MFYLCIAAVEAVVLGTDLVGVADGHCIVVPDFEAMMPDLVGPSTGWDMRDDVLVMDYTVGVEELKQRVMAMGEGADYCSVVPLGPVLVAGPRLAECHEAQMVRGGQADLEHVGGADGGQSTSQGVAHDLVSFELGGTETYPDIKVGVEVLEVPDRGLQPLAPEQHEGVVEVLVDVAAVEEGFLLPGDWVSRLVPLTLRSSRIPRTAGCCRPCRGRRR